MKTVEISIGKLKKVLFHNLTLAVILSLPFVFIINNIIDKFHVETEGPLVMDQYTHLSFNDLNNDGKSDKIYEQKIYLYSFTTDSAFSYRCFYHKLFLFQWSRLCQNSPTGRRAFNTGICI